MPFALFAQNQANQDDFNFGVKVGIAIAMVIHQPKAKPWGSTHHDSALKGPFKVQPCYDRVSSCIVTNFRTQMCMICDCFDENCSPLTCDKMSAQLRYNLNGPFRADEHSYVDPQGFAGFALG